jgi:hypothetical protein
MSAAFLKNHTLCIHFDDGGATRPYSYPVAAARLGAKGPGLVSGSRPGKNIRVTRGKVGKRQKVGVKRYHNREREWRGSAGWLAFVPAVHFRGRGGGLQRCERFQDLVAVARAFRHDPRVARFQVHDLAFDM